MQRSPVVKAAVQPRYVPFRTSTRWLRARYWGARTRTGCFIDPTLASQVELLNGSSWKHSRCSLRALRANWSRTTGEQSPWLRAFRWAILGSNQ